MISYLQGKGYPDTNTRLLLKKIDESLRLPIYALTDADPYGVEIMLTYRHGSLAMSNNNDALAVPAIRWLGIWPSDVERFAIASLEMNNEDRRKVDSIMKRPHISNEIFKELTILKRNGRKAEIEGLAESSCDYLVDVYLSNKLRDNEVI